MSKPITVTDLPSSPKYGVCLYCPKCGETYSATRGDYFWKIAGTPFRCQNDRALLQLRQHRETYDKIDPMGAGR